MLTLTYIDNNKHRITTMKQISTFLCKILNIGKNIQTYKDICNLACGNCQAIHQLVSRSPSGWWDSLLKSAHLNSILLLPIFKYSLTLNYKPINKQTVRRPQQKNCLLRIGTNIASGDSGPPKYLLLISNSITTQNGFFTLQWY